MYAETVRSFFKNSDGASALEFAICAPILLALIFGVFALAFAQHSQSSVRFSVEQASRSLSLDPSLPKTEIDRLVRNKLPEIQPDDLDIDLQITAEGPTGKLGTITATLRQEVSIPMVLTVPLSSTVRIETALRPL
ncbi:MAG: pilus assembly protein [Brevundimonas sp.]|uniref:TadE/TadG family type IV pilus assembly protein n=1 Tax=Brevundimonas sp. TaxID=1871086 RepID=UPI0024874348|nr:pilus assembly protein [Brevundimonas sp.]MDI1326090.1 pilus assembly protein [Brevundimonas sp.]